MQAQFIFHPVDSRRRRTAIIRKVFCPVLRIGASIVKLKPRDVLEVRMFPTENQSDCALHMGDKHFRFCALEGNCGDFRLQFLQLAKRFFSGVVHVGLQNLW